MGSQEEEVLLHPVYESGFKSTSHRDSGDQEEEAPWCGCSRGARPVMIPGAGWGRGLPAEPPAAARILLSHILWAATLLAGGAGSMSRRDSLAGGERKAEAEACHEDFLETVCTWVMHQACKREPVSAGRESWRGSSHGCARGCRTPAQISCSSPAPFLPSPFTFVSKKGKVGPLLLSPLDHRASEIMG